MTETYLYYAAAFIVGVLLENRAALVARVKEYFAPRPDPNAHLKVLVQKLAEKELQK